MNGNITSRLTRYKLNRILQDADAIQHMIAPEETSPALAVHSIDSYLIYNNTFYRVTNNININDLLSTSTNIQATTIGYELEQGNITIVDIPTVETDIYTYSGLAQGPTIIGVDNNNVVVTGTTATEVGVYFVTCSLIDNTNCIWCDGTITDKRFSYSIVKATQTITLSKTQLNLDPTQLTDTVNVTLTAGTGTLSIIVDTPDILTASITNNVITATATGTGTRTIRVIAAENAQYLQATAIIEVDCFVVDPVLNNNSWAVISEASRRGIAASCWNVGDSKSIEVSGLIGGNLQGTTLPGSNTYSLAVFILGFDHNVQLESQGITFSCFNTTDKNMCIRGYNKTDYVGFAKYFAMNHDSYGGGKNTSGWKGCDLRYDILGSTDVAPSTYRNSWSPTTSTVGYDATSTCAISPVADTLMAALPEDLRAVMKPITKYTDNVGNHSSSSQGIESDITTSIDYLPLMSEYEVFGTQKYANTYEQQYQEQYDYYKNNGTTIRYTQYSSGGATGTLRWWLRSPRNNYDYGFCSVETSGTAYYSSSSLNVHGISPIFLV